MLNVDEIFSEPIRLRFVRPTVVGSNATNGKPNSPEARTSDPATVDELQVVEQRNAPTGLLGDDTALPSDCRTLPTYAEGAERGTEARPAVEAEPEPCTTCGNPIFWLLPTGGVRCGNCCPRPEGVALVAVVVTLPDDRLTWEIEPVDAWKRRSK